MPSQQELTQLYSAGHHPHAEDDSWNLAGRVAVMKKVRLLVPEAKALLDIGCGFGQYLRVGRDFGFAAVGVEPDRGRAAVAASSGAEIIPGFFSRELIGNRRFDVAILNHVIEHLPSPETMLREAIAVLNPGGLLFVACPNHGGLNARLLGLHFEHYSPPEHVQYFTFGSLKTLVQRAGLRVLVKESLFHPLHVKELLAHFVYLRPLKKVRYCSPAELDGIASARFVDGPAKPLRKVTYAAVMGISRLLTPGLRLLGGNRIHMFLGMDNR